MYNKMYMEYVYIVKCIWNMYVYIVKWNMCNTEYQIYMEYGIMNVHGIWNIMKCVWNIEYRMYT